MFEKLFNSHPASVGEGYCEHCRHALGFAGAMFTAAFACLIHAFVPALFERSASQIITRLNDRMVTHRRYGAKAEH